MFSVDQCPGTGSGWSAVRILTYSSERCGLYLGKWSLLGKGLLTEKVEMGRVEWGTESRGSRQFRLQAVHSSAH